MGVFGRNQISDKDLLKTVNQRLARTGTASQSKVNVNVQQGTVILTGTLQHAIQRSPILKAVANIPGIRRVVDQMQHSSKKSMRHDSDIQNRGHYVPEPDDDEKAAIAPAITDETANETATETTYEASSE
jgi:hypothetical protein